MHSGPPFSHPSVPYRAHYIGSTTPKDSPGVYIEAIRALMQSYILDVQRSTLGNLICEEDGISDVVPLVVNTMGWTKGLGAYLARQILDIVHPSEIFDIQSTYLRDDNSAHRTGQDDDTYNIHPLQSAQTTGSPSRFTPSDHRTLALLSYFYALFTVDVHIQDTVTSLYAATWKTSTSLCTHTPYEVSTTAAFDAIVLFGPGSEDVVPSELSRVLNGALVGLISHESSMIDLDSYAIEGSNLPYVQGAPPPSPVTSTCCGLALIRSVDNNSPSSRIHMITPVPSKTLAHAAPRLILKGPLEISVWGLLDSGDNGMVEGNNNSEVPYIRWGKGNGIGAERRHTRRNVLRLRLH
jgi:polynucleotide 5'-hydroxyl-kinase GRC3/NOL9